MQKDHVGVGRAKEGRWGQVFEAWGTPRVESQNSENRGRMGEVPEAQDGWVLEGPR